MSRKTDILWFYFYVGIFITACLILIFLTPLIYKNNIKKLPRAEPIYISTTTPAPPIKKIIIATTTEYVTKYIESNCQKCICNENELTAAFEDYKLQCETEIELWKNNYQRLLNK